jgi:two-component system, NarL family, response regulator LiaR
MIRVVIVDDHLVVAEALAVTLGGHDGVSVVGIALSGRQGIDMIERLKPDVAVIDFRLPDLSGADVIRQLTDSSNPCRCVILTGTGLDRALLESIEAGATGFVTKDQRFDEVFEAVVAASRGEVRFPPALLARALPELRRGSNSTWRLTPRERSVLRLLARGRSNNEIGESLAITTNTVRNHVANVLMKLEALSRGEAVAIAIREGLVSIDDG